MGGPRCPLFLVPQVQVCFDFFESIPSCLGNVLTFLPCSLSLLSSTPCSLCTAAQSQGPYSAGQSPVMSVHFQGHTVLVLGGCCP